MADPLRHRQTKGAATDMVDLTPPRHIPTLPSIAATPLAAARLCRDRAGWQVWEYAALVTSLNSEILTLGQLYRDRADCENTFDELKNPWGWGGFATMIQTLPVAGAQCGADLCSHDCAFASSLAPQHLFRVALGTLRWYRGLCVGAGGRSCCRSERNC